MMREKQRDHEGMAKYPQWPCPGCQRLQFAWRTYCRKCKICADGSAVLDKPQQRQPPWRTEGTLAADDVGEEQQAYEETVEQDLGEEQQAYEEVMQADLGEEQKAYEEVMQEDLGEEQQADREPMEEDLAEEQQADREPMEEQQAEDADNDAELLAYEAALLKEHDEKPEGNFSSSSSSRRGRRREAQQQQEQPCRPIEVARRLQTERKEMQAHENQMQEKPVAKRWAKRKLDKLQQAESQQKVRLVCLPNGDPYIR